MKRRSADGAQSFRKHDKGAQSQIKRDGIIRDQHDQIRELRRVIGREREDSALVAQAHALRLRLQEAETRAYALELERDRLVMRVNDRADRIRKLEALVREFADGAEVAGLLAEEGK